MFEDSFPARTEGRAEQVAPRVVETAAYSGKAHEHVRQVVRGKRLCGRPACRFHDVRVQPACLGREPYLKGYLEFRIGYVGCERGRVVASEVMHAVEHLFAVVGKVEHQGVVVFEFLA